MPTMEEELKALKSALSLLQSQHISDVKQLGERIDTLQQQIDEQRRRAFEQSQSLHQRFDSLEKALSQQFAGINQNFLRVDQQLIRLEQQGKQQTEEIKAKFDTVDHFAGRTWGVVQAHEQDIREMKTDVRTIKEQVVEVRQDISGLDVKFDRLEKLLLDRLPPSS